MCLTIKKIVQKIEFHYLRVSFSLFVAELNSALLESKIVFKNGAKEKHFVTGHEMKTSTIKWALPFGVEQALSSPSYKHLCQANAVTLTKAVIVSACKDKLYEDTDFVVRLEGINHKVIFLNDLDKIKQLRGIIKLIEVSLE